jgi:ATP-dependent Lhr-like helicase
VLGVDVEVMWGEEGFVVRFPEVEQPPDPALLLPDAEDVERLVLRQLGSTALFAARFRETASRALLLPRRRPGARTPLWRQRKRAADLLTVAARFGSFPALLETYRECLREVFDMPALVEALRRVNTRTTRVITLDSRVPSPFASSLLFTYVANYIYDGDAPLAERRAQALSVDQTQLRELLGDAELRELLNPEALVAIERRLQHLDEPYKVRSIDGIHDLLLQIGDLTLDELAARSTAANTGQVVQQLEEVGRVVRLRIDGRERYVAVEDAARYRDALGAALPPGLPETLLEPVRDPLGDLILRYARSHAPFTAAEIGVRWGMGIAVVEGALATLADRGRVVEGEFRPGCTGREWSDTDVLRMLRQRSLAILRREIEPVDGDAFGRFMMAWHGIGGQRCGLEPLLDAIEQLQGAAIPASILERDVLPARIADYHPGMLDTLMAAGEVVWVGVEPLGERDGRISLFLTDDLRRLRTPSASRPELGGRAAEIADYLHNHGASFFGALHEGTGGGFPAETVDALWELAWKGLATNDTLHPLRAYLAGPARSSSDSRHSRGRRSGSTDFRSRRLVPPTAEGRWSLLAWPGVTKAAATEWAAAVAEQILTRHGIVTRETMTVETVTGGFSAVYDVLKALEDAGRVRRGYFVAGLGATQFARPAAIELLRSLRDPPPVARTSVVAATDPANPYGTILKWPSVGPTGAESAPPSVATRSAGALVILVDGNAAAYLRRGERELLLFPRESEPSRTVVTREVARTLKGLAKARPPGQRGMLIEAFDGEPAVTHPATRVFTQEGFVAGALGLQILPEPQK